MPRKAKPLEERFWEKVVVNETGCWGWNGTFTNKGYPKLSRSGEKRGYVMASHVSWKIHHGSPVPEGMCVLHRCDSPPCTKPECLFLGTKADNNEDMRNKGRQYTVLTWEQVEEIRASDASERILAKEFGVSKGTIHNVRHGKQMFKEH